ncbi:hypothetical protein ACFSX9_04650 [Flavobacterium ardleyense]|uniref:Uncharacterized protein n=1 Tax=Flavobacterium ardleyense TaxID=2038737 RepID=A0ABW5Z5I2_9FLAO
MSENKNSPYFTAFVISFVITFIYAIVMPFVVSGMYEELAAIIGGIILFVVSFVFYFVYNHFRTIKKLPWLFGGIVIFIGYVILVNSDADIYNKNLFNNSKLPKAYESYQTVLTDEPIYFGKYEMQLKFKSFDPISHFISSKNNLIVITSVIPKDRDFEEVEKDRYGGGNTIFQDYTTYKLDKDGNIIDSYVFKRTYENYTEILFDDYIVNINKNYYKSWILDGDTLSKPFEFKNKDLQWNEEEQVKLYERIVYGRGYYKIEGNNYTVEGKNPEQQIVYFSEGKWYKFFTNIIMPDRDKVSEQRGETTYYANVFGKYEENNYGNAPDWSNFKPVYFQREKFERVTHNIGGNSGSSESIEVNGNLFCNLYVGKDTLKFIKPISFGESGSTQEFYEAKGEKIAQHKDTLEKHYNPYFYYSDKKLNFKLFTIDPYSLYVIKAAK